VDPTDEALVIELDPTPVEFVPLLVVIEVPAVVLEPLLELSCMPPSSLGQPAQRNPNMRRILVRCMTHPACVLAQT
jgi:hypothetical protein